MFDKEKVVCNFKEIPVGQDFYTNRFHDLDSQGESADSIHLTKVTETEAESLEFGKEVIHPEQPCRYFTYK